MAKALINLDETIFLDRLHRSKLASVMANSGKILKMKLYKRKFKA